MESGLKCSALAVWKKTKLTWLTYQERATSVRTKLKVFLSLPPYPLSQSCSPPVSNYPNILASLFLWKDWKNLMCKQYSLWPLRLGCLSQHRHESHNIRLIEERSFFVVLSFVICLFNRREAIWCAVGGCEHAITILERIQSTREITVMFIRIVIQKNYVCCLVELPWTKPAHIKQIQECIKREPIWFKQISC